MERIGLGRRLPATLLDGFFLSIIITIAIVIYSLVAGTGLALKARDSLGVPVNFSNVTSDEVWAEFERESERMIEELEARVRTTFTDEQADFVARTMGNRMEEYFTPENLTAECILTLDARVIDDMIDEAFDAVIAAERQDISTAEINELRADVKELVDRFALGQLVPAAIRFAVWLVLLPVLVTLAYGFFEAIWGRTLGKLALGITIRVEDDDRPAVPAYMLRYVVKYSPLLLAILTVATRIPIFAGIAATSVAVVAIGSLVVLGPQRRALHDYVAGTAVYRAGARDY